MTKRILVCAVAVALLSMGCEVDSSEEVYQSDPDALVELDAMGLLVSVENGVAIDLDGAGVQSTSNSTGIFSTDRDPHCGVVRWQSCSSQCGTQAQCGFCCNFHFQGDWGNPNYKKCRSKCKPYSVSFSEPAVE